MNNNTNNKKERRLKCIALGAGNSGKTSILRRYFHDSFDVRQHPTLGSDFYTGKASNPLYNKENEKKTTKKNKSELPLVTLQIWDTAGQPHGTDVKERRKNHRHHQQSIIAPSDAFFQQAQAAMLVYDATSSTSFTQLIKWYAYLMERIQNNKNSSKMNSKTRIRNQFPVLIVANKMDVIESRKRRQRRAQERFYKIQQLRQQQQQAAAAAAAAARQYRPATTTHYYQYHPYRSKKQLIRQSLTPTKQRDVMGLKGNFRGKDSRYEYRHYDLSASSSSSSSSSVSSSSRYNHLNNVYNQASKQERQHLLSTNDSSSSSSATTISPTSTASSSSTCSSQHPCPTTVTATTATETTATATTEAMTTTTASTAATTVPRQPRSDSLSLTTSYYYMATGDNQWTTDGSYLDSVLHTEDWSHPDRDMVLLWCRRHALPHVEVSARTGAGITSALSVLVEIALRREQEEAAEAFSQEDEDDEEKENNEDNPAATARSLVITNKNNDHHSSGRSIVQQDDDDDDDNHPNQLLFYTANKELDLRQRYAPRQTNWFQQYILHLTHSLGVGGNIFADQRHDRDYDDETDDAYFCNNNDCRHNNDFGDSSCRYPLFSQTSRIRGRRNSQHDHPLTALWHVLLFLCHWDPHQNNDNDNDNNSSSCWSIFCCAQ